MEKNEAMEGKKRMLRPRGFFIVLGRGQKELEWLEGFYEALK